MSNKIRNTQEEILVQEHIHIDNGGTSFELVAYDTHKNGPHLAGIKISDGYYGYSSNEMCLFEIVQNPNNLRKISEFFLKAALAMEEKLKNDREKY